MRALPFLLLLLFYRPASAQISDDFSDGDLSRDPEWIGDVSHWQTGLLRGSEALQSAGDARSDTLSLALHTETAFGRWEFVFAHRDVNLSTFNGVRFFLAADRPSAEDARGYYLQIGTNNSDAVSLWRLDGDLSDARSRVELGRSADAPAAGDSSYLRIAVLRRDKIWRVIVNGDELIRAADDERYGGRYFVVWIKHSAAGARSFFLDDLLIEPGPVPAEPPTIPELPDPVPGDIIVNEIQHDPPPGSSEFIEIINVSADTFDLSRITFRDAQSSPEPISREPAMLEPGAFAVLVQSGSAFSGTFPGVPFIQPARWPALNNGGDEVRLAAGAVGIDSVIYDGAWTSNHRSMERVDPRGPGDRHNFGPSTAPAGATPGSQNSIFRPDEEGPEIAFVEQVDSLVLEIVFSEPLAPEWTQTATIRAGSELASTIVQRTDFLYSTTFRSLTGISYVEIDRLLDRAGNVSESLRFPIAFMPRPGELVVNEIMYEPLADEMDGLADQSEYIELVNRSSRLLALSGLLTTRDPDEHGDADTLSISLPGTALQPGAYYVVHASEMDNAFPPMASGTMSARVRALSLRNGGDSVRLHARDLVLDDLRYEPNWHHGDVAVTRGLSLERIDADGPGHLSENWTTSVAPAGGTPGNVNSVVIRPDRPSGGMAITPSPFSPDHDGRDDIAAIAYRLRADVAVIRIRIFDIGGRLVRDLVRHDLSSGEGTAYWDGLDDLGRKLGIGVYVVLLEAAAERGGLETYKAPVVLARKL